MFTGDRSGDFLYRALHRAGLASKPLSTHVGDGLEFLGAFVTSPVKCVPPANTPTARERAACQPFFHREITALDRVRVLLALGSVGFGATATEFGLKPRPAFAHGLEVLLPNDQTLLCSYHVSQHNTFTGRLTEAMFDPVLERAKTLSVG